MLLRKVPLILGVWLVAHTLIRDRYVLNQVESGYDRPNASLWPQWGKLLGGQQQSVGARLGLEWRKPHPNPCAVDVDDR